MGYPEAPAFSPAGRGIFPGTEFAIRSNWLAPYQPSPKKKKRPRPFSLGRLGSPPPELPTTIRILDFSSSPVNVTLVTHKSHRNKELEILGEMRDGRNQAAYGFRQLCPPSAVVHVAELVVTNPCCASENSTRTISSVSAFPFAIGTTRVQWRPSVE